MITIEQVRTVVLNNSLELSPSMKNERPEIFTAYKAGVRDAIIWDILNHVPEAKVYFLKNYGQYF